MAVTDTSVQDHTLVESNKGGPLEPEAAPKGAGRGTVMWFLHYSQSKAACLVMDFVWAPSKRSQISLLEKLIFYRVAKRLDPSLRKSQRYRRVRHNESLRNARVDFEAFFQGTCVQTHFFLRAHAHQLGVAAPSGEDRCPCPGCSVCS